MQSPKKRGRPSPNEAPPAKDKKVEKKSEKNGDVPAKRGRGRPPKGSKKGAAAKKAGSAGRGRGRPAKPAKKSETEESEDEKEEKDDAEDENNDTENGEGEGDADEDSS